MMEENRKHRWMVEKPEKNRKGEYIGSLVWSVIMLIVANKLPDWNVGFINHNYQVVLYMLNVCIVLQIIGNIFMLVLDFRITRYLSRIVMEAATFVVLILFYYVYPFDFSSYHGWQWLDRWLPILFIIGMIFAVIRVISNAWKLFTRA
jgi:hypothetical protein